MTSMAATPNHAFENGRSQTSLAPLLAPFNANVRRLYQMPTM
jgi:hypothetical protein